MANAFAAAVIPRIFAKTVETLRSQAILYKRSYSKLGDEVKEQGDTITFPFPTPVTKRTVVPANVPPTTVSDSVPSTVQLKLSEWEAADFYITDKEAMDVARGADPRMTQVEECATTLADSVDMAIIAQMARSPFIANTATGTVPFGANLDAYVDMQKILKDNKAPKRGLTTMAVATDAEANLKKLERIQNAEFRSSGPDTLQTGIIGTLYGTEVMCDQNVGSLGTAQAIAVVDGAGAIGDDHIGVDTFTANREFKRGDLIRVAGVGPVYAVRSDLSVAGDLEVFPNLSAAVADNAAIATVAATNAFQFYQQAVSVAVRPLSPPGYGDMDFGVPLTMVDDVSGIPMTIEIWREYKRLRVEFSILFGTEILRPELISRVIY